MGAIRVRKLPDNLDAIQFWCLSEFAYQCLRAQAIKRVTMGIASIVSAGNGHLTITPHRWFWGLGHSRYITVIRPYGHEPSS